MISTHLFITQTFLDVQKLQKNIAYNFFKTNKIKVEAIEIEELINETWQNKLNMRQIIYWNPNEIEGKNSSQKDKFRDFIQNEIYKIYSKDTLLFLGDLGSYSEELQEGMLKILEEPPSNVRIIILAHSLNQVKPTIVSRSQIHNLASKNIFANLDQEMLEKVKNLPQPKLAVQKLLKNQNFVIEKDILKNADRNELDFWMWQLQTNLSAIYAQNPQIIVSEKIERVIFSRKLNKENTLKKLVISNLFL